MHNQADLDASLLVLAFFVAQALLGVMYIEWVLKRRERRREQHIDSIN